MSGVSVPLTRYGGTFKMPGPVDAPADWEWFNEIC